MPADLAKNAVAQADALEEAGDLDGAIAVLTDAIEMCSNQPRLLALRGRLFKIREQWAKAISDFDAALALKPNAATTLYFRGQCRAMIADFDGAITDFEKCIELQPASADAYLEIGTIHSYRNNTSACIAAYNKAYELDPNRYAGLKDEVDELKRRLD